MVVHSCAMGTLNPPVPPVTPADKPADPSPQTPPVLGERKPPRAESRLPSADYQLVWSDEFEGADGASPDPSKWGYWLLGKQGEQVNWRDGAFLDGQGNLKMQTTKHEVYDRRGKKSVEYRAAFLSTEHRYETTYGYFEARMKFQKQVGHWSAFWINTGTLGTPRKDPARAGVEIDIIEYMTDPMHHDQAMHTIHWDNKTPDHKQDHAMVKVPGLSEGWHLVACEWTQEAIVFYVDGKETYRTSKAIPKKDQYMVLSMHVGDWAGRIEDATLPDSCLVDHVRVFKREGGHASPRTSGPDHSAIADFYKRVPESRGGVPAPGSGTKPLTRPEADLWKEAAWKAYRSFDSAEGTAAKRVIEAGKVTKGAVSMPFTSIQTGARPTGGWPVVIGLHDSPAAGLTTDDAWHLQLGKQTFPGLYVCPKSPGSVGGTAVWSDPATLGMLDRLLDALIIANGIDPSRVVVWGTGDGASAAMRWMLSRPDRFAGVAATGGVLDPAGQSLSHAAGMPLRAIVGERDTTAVAHARAWASVLGTLGSAAFEVDEQAGRAKTVSSSSLPEWAGARVRARPTVSMLVPSGDRDARVGMAEVEPLWITDAPKASAVVSVRGQRIEVTAQGLKRVRLLLDDADIDLDRQVEIVVNNSALPLFRLDRSASTIVKSTARFGDSGLVPSVEFEVDVPTPK